MPVYTRIALLENCLVTLEFYLLFFLIIVLHVWNYCGSLRLSCVDRLSLPLV